MSQLRRLAPLGAAFLLAACGAAAQTGSRPVDVAGRSIPLDRGDIALTSVGALAYAGGLTLDADDSPDFGGLSGLDVEPDGRFIAVTDAGDLVRGRLVLDSRARLVRVAEVSLLRLTDETGRPFGPKWTADAEDVTFLPGGGFAVSFEQDHRVLVYRPDAPARRLEPPPGARLSPNTGLEALTVWKDAGGSDRMVMGAEVGDAWACALDGGDCRQILEAGRDNPGKDFRLTGLDALPDGRLAAVYRAATLLGGLRAVVAVVDPDAPRPVTVLARLDQGMVDNMEAIAAVPAADGTVGLYLASDDNFSGWLRTLVLAFDWSPSGQTKSPAGAGRRG